MDFFNIKETLLVLSHWLFNSSNGTNSLGSLATVFSTIAALYLGLRKSKSQIQVTPDGSSSIGVVHLNFYNVSPNMVNLERIKSHRLINFILENINRHFKGFYHLKAFSKIKSKIGAYDSFYGKSVTDNVIVLYPLGTKYYDTHSQEPDKYTYQDRDSLTIIFYNKGLKEKRRKCRLKFKDLVSNKKYQVILKYLNETWVVKVK